VILDSGDGVLIKHTRETLRGLLKGEIDVDKFEKELKKLRKSGLHDGLPNRYRCFCPLS